MPLRGLARSHRCFARYEEVDMGRLSTTAVELAAEIGNEEVLTYLIQRGARVTADRFCFACP